MEENYQQTAVRLAQETQARLAVVEQEVSSIRRYIRWLRWMSTLRFLLVAIPIVLGIIYLPPVIRQYLDQYMEFLKQ